jgi:hypothetical protein
MHIGYHVCMVDELANIVNIYLRICLHEDVVERALCNLLNNDADVDM